MRPQTAGEIESLRALAYEVLRRDPAARDAHLRLYEIEQMLGRPAAAIAHLRMALRSVAHRDAPRPAATGRDRRAGALARRGLGSERPARVDRRPRAHDAAPLLHRRRGRGTARRRVARVRRTLQHDRGIGAGAARARSRRAVRRAFRTHADRSAGARCGARAHRRRATPRRLRRRSWSRRSSAPARPRCARAP